MSKDAPGNASPPPGVQPVGIGGMVREALLQRREGGKVRCLTCQRQCLLGEGQAGWCRTRENRGGTLFTTIYGLVSSLSANPIEKKPLFHFYPGSVALTVGSWSCNFACPWCQNWEISKRHGAQGRFMTPLAFVDLTLRLGCQGTSISFNEPTLSLEWALEVFRLARKRGLYNTFVTNGYMTEEALGLLIEAGLDAMNVDIKGDAEAVRKFCQADVEVVWRNALFAKSRGVHVEVTTLVIPTVNQRPSVLQGIAWRIAEELGEETPWHLTAYFPAYRFHAPPTPLAALEEAHAWGKEAGLKFVYLGNVAGHPWENTYCPACGALLIRRLGVTMQEWHLQGRTCPACGEEIPIVGEEWWKR